MNITKIDEFKIRVGNGEIPSISNDRLLCVVGINEIEHIVPNKDETVLISITEPESDDISEDIKSRYFDVLNVKFWDVVKTGGKYLPIILEQGMIIREFILRHVDKKFAVHCFAGISRSAWVTQGVLCLLECEGDVYTFQTAYKDPIKAHWRYLPNKTVFNAVVDYSGEIKINHKYLRELLKRKQVSDEQGAEIVNTLSRDLLGIYNDELSWLYITEYELAKILSISDGKLQEMFYQCKLKCPVYKTSKDYCKRYHEYVVTHENHNGKFTSIVWSTSVVKLFAEMETVMSNQD